VIWWCPLLFWTCTMEMWSGGTLMHVAWTYLSMYIYACGFNLILCHDVVKFLFSFWLICC
jgi:hypothetical protein